MNIKKLFLESLSKGKTYTQININTAGGSPAAGYFLLPRQKESNQRKGDGTNHTHR